MTDRIHALAVILDDAIREDDVEHIIQAISMIRNVNGVQKHVADTDTYFAVEKARKEIAVSIMAALSKK